MTALVLFLAAQTNKQAQVMAKALQLRGMNDKIKISMKCPFGTESKTRVINFVFASSEQVSKKHNYIYID